MVVIEKLNIRLLIVESDKEPYEKTVRNRLDKFRQIIGNDNIEVIVFDEDTLLIFDADAFVNNVEVNRILGDGYKIRGTFILTGNNEKEQDFKDITDEQIAEYKNLFRLSNEIIHNRDMEEGEDMELWRKKELYHFLYSQYFVFR